MIQNEISTRFRPHTLVTSVTLKGLAVPTLLAEMEMMLPDWMMYMMIFLGSDLIPEMNGF
jgi:hypothetical protein